MKLWERLLAVGIIALLIPVTFMGFIVVCCVAIARALWQNEPNDPDFWRGDE
jgi:hypothetical protein